jgi:hypothetical protein
MGNQLGAPSGGAGFSPSDSFFLLEASRRGDVAVLSMFLSKNPACAFAHSMEDGSTGWHYSAQVCLYASRLHGSTHARTDLRQPLAAATSALELSDGGGEVVHGAPCNSMRFMHSGRCLSQAHLHC